MVRQVCWDRTKAKVISYQLSIPPAIDHSINKPVNQIRFAADTAFLFLITHTNTQTDRQTDRQTETHTDVHVYIYIYIYIRFYNYTTKTTTKADKTKHKQLEHVMTSFMC